jgi:hypothetical protein
MSRLTIEFNTTDYTFSHGHNPRGRGAWAFAIGSKTAQPRFFNGTYGEAKKQLRAQLIAEGAEGYYIIYTLA